VWRRKKKLTADSFAHDPLARRIFVRSQSEYKKRAAGDAFWDTAWIGSRAQSNVIVAAPIFLMFALAWGIIAALWEEAVLMAYALRDKIRVRRGRRYVRRARRYRSMAKV
jgi:hypothetical protein